MALLFLTVWFCGCTHGGFAWGVVLTASQIVVFVTHDWGLLTKTNSSDATPTQHQAVRPSCVQMHSVSGVTHQVKSWLAD